MKHHLLLFACLTAFLTLVDGCGGGPDDHEILPTQSAPALNRMVSGCDNRIGDRVWHDLNCNGIQDPGEPGIPNVGLLIFGISGSPLDDTIRTDANGFYSFTNQCDGGYFVEVITPDGYTPAPTLVGDDRTIDSNPSPAEVVIFEPDSTDLTIDFGFCREVEDTACGKLTGGGKLNSHSCSNLTFSVLLHCDGSSPNKLEVNWKEGHHAKRFHMTSLTSISCTDDSTIIPDPPPAPFDTFTGTGTGKYNNMPGATVEFMFADAGEPGRHDRASIRIRSSSGALLLDVSGRLKGGNLQAHGCCDH